MKHSPHFYPLINWAVENNVAANDEFTNAVSDIVAWGAQLRRVNES